MSCLSLYLIYLIYNFSVTKHHWSDHSCLVVRFQVLFLKLKSFQYFARYTAGRAADILRDNIWWLLSFPYKNRITPSQCPVFRVNEELHLLRIQARCWQSSNLTLSMPYMYYYVLTNKILIKHNVNAWMISL